jgi:hypothetical protein
MYASRFDRCTSPNTCLQCCHHNVPIVVAKDVILKSFVITADLLYQYFEEHKDLAYYFLHHA